MDPEDGDDFDDIQDFDDTDDQGLEPDDQQDGEDDQSQGDDPDGGDPEPERSPSRLERRAEVLAARRTQEFERIAQDAADRAERAERQLREIQTGSSRAETERREQERLAQMDPWDRAQYQTRQVEERTTSEVQALRREMAESSDRAEFATACASNPALARVKDKVEAELSKLRASGTNVPRQTLAAYLIGQQLLEKAPKARERTAKRAAANLDRERTRPASGASDAPRGGGKDEKAARDKRLEDFTF